MTASDEPLFIASSSPPKSKPRPSPISPSYYSAGGAHGPYGPSWTGTTNVTYSTTNTPATYTAATSALNPPKEKPR